MDYTPKNEFIDALKDELIQALGECSFMKTDQNRDIVVQDIGFDAHITRSKILRADIKLIVEDCWGRENGLRKLLNRLEFYEGDSFAVQNVKEKIQSLETARKNLLVKPKPPEPLPPIPPKPSIYSELFLKLRIVFWQYYKALVMGIILLIIITIIFVRWQNLSMLISETSNTPTPKPTLIPISKLTEIKSDDFNSTKSGWDTYNNDDTSTGYQNGEYFIEIKRNPMVFLSVWGNGGKIKEGILQVEVRGPFGTRGAEVQGLLWGWQSNSQLPHYAFAVNEIGKCIFYKSTGKSSILGQTPSGVVPYSTPETESKGNQSRILNVVIKGNDVYGYIDGIFCASYTMPEYEPGFIGVVASSPDGKGKSFFDNYKIFKLPD